MTRFLPVDHERLILLLGACHVLPVPLLAQGLPDIPPGELRSLLAETRAQGYVASARPSTHLRAAHGDRDGVRLTPRGRVLWRQVLQDRLQRRGPVGARTRRAA